MINGIVVYRSFNRVNAEVEIAIIHVQGTNIISFLAHLFAQATIQDINIINISFLDTKDGTKE